MFGLKRSWKFTAAVMPRARQASRITVASARSIPIGFCSSAAEPSGSLATTFESSAGGTATSKTHSCVARASSSVANTRSTPKRSAVARPRAGSRSNTPATGSAAAR
jgi:hypothetical protein